MKKERAQKPTDPWYEKAYQTCYGCLNWQNAPEAYLCLKENRKVGLLRTAKCKTEKWKEETCQKKS